MPSPEEQTWCEYLGAVHDGVASVKLVGIVQLSQALFCEVVPAVNDPSAEQPPVSLPSSLIPQRASPLPRHNLSSQQEPWHAAALSASGIPGSDLSLLLHNMLRVEAEQDL